MLFVTEDRLVKGPYQPICKDCAMYFSTTVPSLFSFASLFDTGETTCSKNRRLQALASSGKAGGFGLL